MTVTIRDGRAGRAGISAFIRRDWKMRDLVSHAVANIRRDSRRSMQERSEPWSALIEVASGVRNIACRVFDRSEIDLIELQIRPVPLRRVVQLRGQVYELK